VLIAAVKMELWEELPSWPADIDSTRDGIGCSLSWNLLCHLQLFSYDDPTRPIRTRSVVVRAAALYRCRFGDCGACFGLANPHATKQATFQTVYVNFLLIVMAILVVIFSIWGYHQLK
jgi:hypothetical protein